MLKVENIEVYGWASAIRGARNPMNSWEKLDSKFFGGINVIIGPNDYKMLKGLCIAGTDHRKFMRMINVTMDITAPLYWWKEFDTYKVSTVANSCSTMHKIQAKEFALDDFSCEHLTKDSIEILQNTINTINKYRDKYNNYTDKDMYIDNDSQIVDKKVIWWQMIQLLPSSYNQKRTVQVNYEVLNTMYHARKNHKLDEWHALCDAIERLPYSEFITMEFEGGTNEK